MKMTDVRERLIWVLDPPGLERLKTPTKEKIADAIRQVCYANGSR